MKNGIKRKIGISTILLFILIIIFFFMFYLTGFFERKNIPFLEKEIYPKFPYCYTLKDISNISLPTERTITKQEIDLQKLKEGESIIGYGEGISMYPAILNNSFCLCKYKE